RRARVVDLPRLRPRRGCRGRRRLRAMARRRAPDRGRNTGAEGAPLQGPPASQPGARPRGHATQREGTKATGARRPLGRPLRRQFEASGLDLEKPVTTSCGSGVTASVLALGLFELGRPDVAVYDGSWTEWGGRADTPIER